MPHHLPTLSITRPLLDWLRDTPEWRILPWHLRALLRWRATLGSLNVRLSAQQAAQRQVNAPLFIAGPWRSGSTVMHELLHAVLGWPTPRTWQCMDPTAFRLRRAPRPGLSVARPMDGLDLGPMSPQEDEFALLALGVDSAYRGFWMPHRLDTLLHTLDPAYWAHDSDWLTTCEGFLSEVQGDEPRLLLKSPNHSFRLPVMLKRFPSAQVVWMLRDGEAVFASNRKMWSQMAKTHGLTALDPLTLDRFVAEALRRCADVLDAIGSLPSCRLAFCWQQNLQSNAKAELIRLLDQLQLQPQLDRGQLQQALARVAKGRVEHYAPLCGLSADSREAIDRFNAAQRRAAAT